VNEEGRVKPSDDLLALLSHPIKKRINAVLQIEGMPINPIKV